MPVTRDTRALSEAVVARLGLGTAALGHLYQAVTDATAEEVVNAAWTAGIRLFDTAHLYGGGLAEHRLGAALAHRPRAAYRLATKVGCYRPYGQGPIPPGSSTRRASDVWDYSRDTTLRAVETSLNRLRTDYIDVVHVHGFDQHFEDATRGAFPVLWKLKEEGVVRAVGGACDAVAPLENAIAERRVDTVLCAGRYTLIDQSAKNLLLSAERTDVAVVVASIFNSGILATGPIEGCRFDYMAAPDGVRAHVRAIDAFCQAEHIPLRAAALQFPLLHPCVRTMLLGPATASELEDSLANLITPLPHSFWQRLDSRGLIHGLPPMPLQGHSGGPT